MGTSYMTLDNLQMLIISLNKEAKPNQAIGGGILNESDLIFWHTSITIVYTLSNGSKYFFQILIICLHSHKWFQTSLRLTT